MRPHPFRRWTIAAASVCLSALAVAQTTPGLAGEIRRPWDLDSEYPDAAAWSEALQSVVDRTAVVTAEKGRPIRDASQLADLLDKVRDARGRAGRMARYALLKSSVDIGSEVARSKYHTGTQLEARVETAAAWVDNAVRGVGQEQVHAWIAEEPRLRRHLWRIAYIFRETAHADPAGAEELAAALERATEAPLDVYRAVMTADLSWPSITGPDREARLVNYLTYPQLRRHENRAVRDLANRAFLEHLQKLEAPLGLLLTRKVEAESELARVRHFTNGIDNFFEHNDGIPPGSYHRIFQYARENRATAARYLKLMARVHGVTNPNLGDLNAPPVSDSARFSASAAIADIIAAWAPAGGAYQRLMRDRLNQPWLDLYPDPRKDSSAGGVYWAVGGGHPYVLLSYEGDLPSAEQLAASATLLMFYADLPPDKRPERREEDFPVYSNALWFLGELLYGDDLLAKTNSKAEKIALLSSQLYHLWNAYFQFGIATELEHRIAISVHENKPLTGQQISETYFSLLKDYYGEPGIQIDPAFAQQWMTFPFIFDARHILPEWAMAVAAGAHLTAKVEGHDERALAALRSPLGNPASMSSHDLLMDAGIAMESDGPYKALIDRMNRDLDQLEQETR